MDEVRVAVQITSSGTADASLSKDRRNAISEEARKELSVVWLPPRVEYDAQCSGASVESSIFLFISGVLFAAVLKPFVESVAAEAGKDFWSYLKTLVARIRKAQVEETYSVNGVAYIVFELGEEYVLIKLDLGTVSDKADLDTLDKQLSEQLKALALDWGSITEMIERFGVGERREHVQRSDLYMHVRDTIKENQVHVISCHDDHFDIWPEPASRYFGRA